MENYSFYNYAAGATLFSVLFVFSGGVASNSMVRKELSALQSVFSEPQYSTDNAMGVAILAHRSLED